MQVMIMAGGKGERFWPYSRLSTPKQLLPIVSKKSMIEETIERLEGIVEQKDIFISTRRDLVDSIKKVLPDFPEENYIVEPFPRDTAPAIGLATVVMSNRRPGDVMVVLPADHYIKDKEMFQKDLLLASKVAQDTGCLLTFGIQPDHPETGYGYIELGEIVSREYDSPVYEVKSFKEKPDYETAKKYYESKRFLWNSGMFVWTTNAILNAIERYMPSLFEGLMKIRDSIGKFSEEKVKEEEFEKFEKISIDYGVMEKADNVLCLKARFDWSDVGSWSALEKVKEKDENGNVISSDWAGIDTRNSIIVNDEGIIGTIGVRDLLIIKYKDALLVADKNREQEIKKLVEKIAGSDKLKKYIL